MPTKQRIEKVTKLLSQRQPDLRVALEEVQNTHNASAVVRTCDAAGILYMEIISASEKPFPVNDSISTGAEKWVKFNHHNSTSQCLARLKREGFTIVSTYLESSSLPYTEVDYTRPTVLVFGNEMEGISEEALKYSDELIKIPMKGMVQSLNLSVSVGIILYEALKQREKKGDFQKTKLSPAKLESLKKEFLSPLSSD